MTQQEQDIAVGRLCEDWKASKKATTLLEIQLRTVGKALVKLGELLVATHVPNLSVSGSVDLTELIKTLPYREQLTVVFKEAQEEADNFRYLSAQKGKLGL